MSFVNTINRFGDSLADGFTSADIAGPDAIKLIKGEVLSRGGEAVLMGPDGAEIMSVADDAIGSGRALLELAACLHLTNRTGIRIRSPTSAYARSVKFEQAGGISYTDYLTSMVAGDGEPDVIQVRPLEDATYSLTVTNAESGKVYVCSDDMDAYDLSEVYSLVARSGVESEVRLPIASDERVSVNKRDIARVRSKIPADVPFIVGEEFISIGEVGRSVAPYAPGPEDRNSVMDAVRAISSLTVDTDAVLKKASAATMPAPAQGQRAAAVAVLFPPFPGDFCLETVQIIDDIATAGVGAISRDAYVLAASQTRVKSVFGDRMGTNGKLQRHLSDRIKTWREFVEIDEMSLESIVSTLAGILTHDGGVNQPGLGVQCPPLAAALLVARSASLYGFQYGAAKGDDGQHYATR